MLAGNPKQAGSNLIDCKPQKGKCPVGCFDCFYNRPGAFYTDISKAINPTIKDAKNKIVRVNSGHDSNIQRSLVIRSTNKYKHRFFNTSISKFDFPAPVVYTANPKEELPVTFLRKVPNNLMFVRLKVSATNLMHVFNGVEAFAVNLNIPVVLTFMAYYTKDPGPWYEWKVRHINSYWCPRRPFVEDVVQRAKLIAGRMVTMCGTFGSNLCKDCGNCETYYWQTLKHLEESKYEFTI